MHSNAYNSVNMKTVFRIVLFLLLSIPAFSVDREISYSVTSNGLGIFTVNYQSSQAGKVKVSIYDAKKNLVYSEVIANVNSFSRPYNFNGLPAGEYTLYIESTSGKYEEKIAYQGNKERGMLRFFKLPAA